MVAMSKLKKMYPFFLRRSRPDPRQHVPDCSNQPRPGQPACPGCHGTCCHTHRQHCHIGRPGSGGCNSGAVTIKILEGVGGTEWPPWGFVYPTVFQDITLCTMSIIFKCTYAGEVKVRFQFIVFTV